jgi:isocitrate lyase
MKAYVEIIQRRERELGTDILTHQKVRTLLLVCNEERQVDLTITLSGAARTMLIT